MPPLTLLFLAANPTDTARLGVADEHRAVDQALLKARYRECFNLIPHGAVRVEDFPELLLRHHPHLLHFSGHGGPSNQIALENQDGFTHPVPLELLRAWFAVLKDDLRCVVLNACDSEEQARAIAEYVDVVIGMSRAISDSGAIVFSAAFYHAIACGRSLQDAFNLGCAALQAQDPAEQDVPRLIAPRADPAQIVLVPAPEAAPRPAAAPLPPIDLAELSASSSELFLGRQAELDELQTHLTGQLRAGLVAIYGAPGQGKTTLARHAAERFAPAFPSGALAFSLENPRTRLDLLSRLAVFLDLDTRQASQLLERQIVGTLERRPLLLVLDNAETFLHALESDDPVAIDLNDFLQNQLPPSVTLLVTSRDRFSLGREHEIPLDLRGLAPAEGAALFQQHAPNYRAELDPAQLQDLSRRLDGHPLSLRLLGSAFNASGLRLPAFLEGFEARLIAAKRHVKNPAQRTLAACIQTSIDPLPQELNDLLPQLTLFHAPFQPASAVAILDPDTAPDTSPLPARLRQLWQRGLLDRQTDPLELYHFLPSIRLHVAQTAPNPTDSTFQRFAQTYADLIQWIEGEIGNGSTAPFLAHILAPDLDRVLDLCSGAERASYSYNLGSVWYQLGNTWEGQTYLENALKWGREHDDRRLVAHALNELGLIASLLGQPQQALDCFLEALPIEKELEEQINEASTLNNVAGVYLDTARLQEALTALQEVLQSDRRMNNRAGEATTLNNIGVVYDNIGQPQEALRCYHEALPIHKEVGDRAGEATTLNNIGLVYRATGQPQEALRYLRETQPIFKEVGDRVSEVGILNNIGVVYDDIGQPQEALRYYLEALPILKEVGDRDGEATTLNNIGTVYQSTGQSQEALRYLREALPIFKEIGNRAMEATALTNIGAVYHATSQPQEALRCCREALLIRQEIGDRAGEAITLNSIGAVYHAIGQPQEALGCLREALPICKEVGDRAGETSTLNNMAMLLFAESEYHQAVDLLRQALSIAQEIQAVAVEAAALGSLASILGSYFGEPAEAVQLLRRSVELLKTHNLPQDASGATLAQHEAILAHFEAQLHQP